MVEYTTNPAVPGRLFFRCERMRATLSTASCSEMWRRANDQNDGSNAGCKLCPLGAVHAGEVAASMSPLKGTLTCSRCHRPAERLIRRMHCVSCYNRAREFVIGYNAKGTAPVKLRALDRRTIRFLCGDQIQRFCLGQSLDNDELIVATLRDSKKRVFFGFNSEPPPSIRQFRLW